MIGDLGSGPVCAAQEKAAIRSLRVYCFLNDIFFF